jgi:hypothetical protein
MKELESFFPAPPCFISRQTLGGEEITYATRHVPRLSISSSCLRFLSLPAYYAFACWI